MLGRFGSIKYQPSHLLDWILCPFDGELLPQQQGGGGPIGDEVLLEVVAGPQCDCWGG